MPRASRSTTTAALSILGDDNLGVAARKRKVAAPNECRAGNADAKSNAAKGGKRRAVLGEITNAFVGASRREAKKVLGSNASSQQSGFKYSIKPQIKVDEETTKSEELEKVVEEIAEKTPQETAEHSKEEKLQETAGKDSKQEEELKDEEFVFDFDQTNLDDPFQVAEYAAEIFGYYKSRESSFVVPDYLSQGIQPEMSTHMRAVLVDWLVEVQESFELNHETLYTAVKILDLYFAKKAVKKDELQLYGAVCVLIACKIDERLPPLLDDFVYVCDDAYDKQQIISTEIKVLDVVGFDLGYPLSYRFLRRFGRVCGVTMETLTLARFVLELSLMEYSLNVETSESKLAASALILALKLKRIEDWESQLSHYSGYRVSDCEHMVNRLLQMVKENRAQHSKKTIRTKYSHRVFHEVALVPLPESISC